MCLFNGISFVCETVNAELFVMTELSPDLRSDLSVRRSIDWTKDTLRRIPETINCNRVDPHSHKYNQPVVSSQQNILFLYDISCLSHGILSLVHSIKQSAVTRIFNISENSPSDIIPSSDVFFLEYSLWVISSFFVYKGNIILTFIWTNMSNVQMLNMNSDHLWWDLHLLKLHRISHYLLCSRTNRWTEFVDQLQKRWTRTTNSTILK